MHRVGDRGSNTEHYPLFLILSFFASCFLKGVGKPVSILNKKTKNIPLFSESARVFTLLF